MNDPALPESVVLFTQDGCRASADVRACFRASGVPFVERNASRDPAAVEALLVTGVFATPLVAAPGRPPFVAGRLDALAAALGFRCSCPTPRDRP